MAGIVLRGKAVTDEQRAAHVKKLATKLRAKAIKKMSAAKKKAGRKKLAAALDIPGEIISDEVNEPGANHYLRKLTKGTYLRIIDLGGQQAVDFLCFDQASPEIRYNAANSIKLNETLYITTGFKLYSDTAEVLMTLTADTVGKHDTIGGACSNQVNYLRYGIKNTCSCRDNFISALKTVGHASRATSTPISTFFMHVPGRQERPHRHPRRPVAAGRLRRASRREGRDGGHFELSAILQSLLGLESDADPGH